MFFDYFNDVQINCLSFKNLNMHFSCPFCQLLFLLVHLFFHLLNFIFIYFFWFVILNNRLLVDFLRNFGILFIFILNQIFHVLRIIRSHMILKQLFLDFLFFNRLFMFNIIMAYPFIWILFFLIWPLHKSSFNFIFYILLFFTFWAWQLILFHWRVLRRQNFLIFLKICFFWRAIWLFLFIDNTLIFFH